MINRDPNAEIGEASINLAAAIQMIGSLTTTIGCIAGLDVAHEALGVVASCRDEQQRLIDATRRMAPPDTYLPQAPEKR